ncbi:TRAP transporter substrate-binding protein [Ideonella sp. DXS22W]|uniref:TRAP transporter substrate-binding protein n=1 Tax=Pseudaquabacterium inlustre TaxID=2984192 RepID=A0ABU9CM30_9BURK
MNLTLRLAAIALAATCAAGAANAQFQDRNFRLSSGSGKDHPTGNGIAKMASCAQAKSGGKMKITPYWDNQLGNDSTATQSVRSGTIDLVIPSTAPLVAMVPELGVLDLPFLFSNEAEADQVLDGKAGAYFSAKLPAVGLVNLAYWENGFRNATNSKRPITRIEDFSGLKMRVMQNPVYIDTFKELGANAVPMAFSEVYSALETKTVDGQENPFALIDNMKFYEVQKYLSLTKHSYAAMAMLMSKKVWDGLSPQEQDTLKACAVEGRDEQRKVSRAKNGSTLAELKSKGMQVNDIAPAEMARIRDKVKVVYEHQAGKIGNEAMGLVMGELKRIRGQ